MKPRLLNPVLGASEGNVETRLSSNVETWLSIPHKVRKQGTALFDQQIWCFGCDIRRKNGNALLEYGFERTRPPEGVKGSSQYCLQLRDGMRLTLWAFGVYFGVGPQGGLLLRRYEFSPRLLLDPGQAWKPQHLSRPRLPGCQAECDRVRGLLPAALRWLADYEEWALVHLGAEYRADCLAAWPKRAVTMPEETPQAWRELAQACEGLKMKQK